MSDAPPGDVRIRAAVQKLESLRAAGVTHLPKAPAVVLPDPELSTPTAPSVDQPAAMPKKSPAKTKKSTPESPAAALAVVQKKVAACTRCAELASLANTNRFRSRES